MHAFHINKQTQIANTAIVDIVPPVEGFSPRLDMIQWTSVTTDQEIVIMRPVADTVIDGGVSSGTGIDIADTEAMNTVNTPGSRELIAGADYVMYQTDLGYEWNSVASVSGNTLTLDNAIGDRVVDQAKIWIFGETGRATHFKIDAPVGASVLNYCYCQPGITAEADTANVRSGVGDGLIIFCSNVTTASTLVVGRGLYFNDGSAMMN